MINLKRHMGRRIAGIGVGVAFLVLGLEAPAFAANPTISSFTPATGPVGCVVTITGTNFDNPNVTSVLFNTTAAASFSIDSATSITAVVNTGTTTGAIHVTNASGTADSATSFTVGSSSCPTIPSFTPTCGAVGSAVALTGTNFTGATGVEFNGTNAPAFSVASATRIDVFVPTGATTGPIRVTTPSGTGSTLTNFTVSSSCATITGFTPTHGPVGTVVTITGTGFTGATGVTFNTTAATTFTVVSATSITATVPTGATTGKIKVTVGGGTVTSTDDFVVSTTHARTITLALKKHLVAKGTVSVADSTTACVSDVPVKIQRRKSGHWKTVGSTSTSASGSYKKRIKDKPGKYRAKAPKVSVNSNADDCLKAVSASRRNR